MKGNIRKYTSVFLLSVGIVLLGCSRVDVSTQQAPNLNMKAYKTYAWLPPTDTLSNSFAKDQVVSGQIISKVNQELQEKGYRLEVQNPDLLVLVRANYDKELDYQTIAPSYNYGPGFYTGPWYDYYYPSYGNLGYISGGPLVREVEYTQGTVIIDLIDSRKNQVVWRGVATDEIYEDDEIAKETVENVEEIFEEFPG